MHPWGPQVHKLYNKLGGYTCVRVCIVCVCVRVHGRHRQTYRHLSSRRWAGVLQPTRQEIMDGFSASSEIGPAMILARRWGQGALLEQPPASLRCSPSLFSLFISLSHPYTPRLRLSWSLRTVLSTDTNIFFTNFFAAVCVYVRASMCVCFPPACTVSRVGCKWVSQTLIRTDFPSLAEWKIILLMPKIVPSTSLLGYAGSLQLRSSRASFVFSVSLSAEQYMVWRS